MLVARRYLAFTGLEETECTRSIIHGVLVSERSTADRQTISDDVLGWLHTSRENFGEGAQMVEQLTFS